jgi:hypothetical protein
MSEESLEDVIARTLAQRDPEAQRRTGKARVGSRPRGPNHARYSPRIAQETNDRLGIGTPRKVSPKTEDIERHREMDRCDG